MAIQTGTSIEAGTHKIGPSNGSLKINTKREGMAAKVGHDLVLGATDWEATVEASADGIQSVELTVNPSSIEVLGGAGGAKPLSDKDRADIKKNIAGKVLGTSQISFKSSDAQGSAVRGDLSIAGKSNPISVPLSVSDAGKAEARVTLTQSTFGIKPFTALMGALKVADDVEIVAEGNLPTG